MMKWFLGFLLFLSSQTNLAAASVIIKKPIIIAHYMSWYQTPDISGSWGFWQVNRPTIPKEYWHYPDRILENNCRDISSVYYPVIGPYDSADPDLCEYHILLAKLSGIDAFVADWYGPDPSAEHPYDNIGFSAMKKAAEKLNFKVMICWEDRSVFPPISAKVANRAQAIDRAKEMIGYLEKEWFSSPAYLKIGNRPVLTNFAWGSPGKDINEPWLNSAEWNEIINFINPRPVFIHDWHRHRTVNEFDGYESVMPWGCTYHGDSDSASDFWQASEKAIDAYERFSFLSGAVLPGFDNRGCGGWGSDGAIGITERRNGDKFRATWEDCLKHNVKFIQIATWNDLNEGGTIEPVLPLVLHQQSPAEGYGYRELETAAEYIGKLKKSSFDKEALRLPARLYFARKKINALKTHNSPYLTNVSVSELIKIADKVGNYLVFNDYPKAKKLLEKLDKYLSVD
ncbi:MAG: hypothetical protein A2Y10_09330 [Planctomycetes bacterium GWF2_41_51]|nr:MAG: hypothetical protein A2Y10_09330 [Planctomycetes bacterium GWF2_41_51]HBG27871.1 hypothetical protein [Phycisphaerales bacterium]